MPRRNVMVIGSGPIVIGQAAEFDYAGVQACRALREEGHRVVLVNSNPATIMTDPEIADAVYLEPLDGRVDRSRSSRASVPTRCLPTLGGQTGLNLAVELARSRRPRTLRRRAARHAGRDDQARRRPRALQAQDARDRRAGARERDRHARSSRASRSRGAAGYPLVVRPAYTLGGTGGGIVYDEAQLRETLDAGLAASLIHQALLETSLLGWKEIEYEVLRDRAGNCIIVCNMENIDPVGVHTGDSIVVAPSQTLSDLEYQMLRTASINVIRALDVQGGCNIQFALHPDAQRVRDHRSQPARLAQLGARVESDRLSDRQDLDADRARSDARRDSESGHRRDEGRLRADARLRRRQDSALAVRQVSARRHATRARR